MLSLLANNATPAWEKKADERGLRLDGYQGSIRPGS